MCYGQRPFSYLSPPLLSVLALGPTVIHTVYSCLSLGLEWDVCKSPGFPSNRVAAGQVDPPAVRITMVCSLFACCLSASEAFLFLPYAVCWVFSNAYTKEEHLLVFFVASDRRRAGVTRRRRPLVDCATPPRHLSKKQKSKSLGLNNVPA